MTQCPVRWTRRPTGTELVRQVGALVADLPRFLTAMVVVGLAEGIAIYGLIVSIILIGKA